jgi:hypothetical protein
MRRFLFRILLAIAYVVRIATVPLLISLFSKKLDRRIYVSNHVYYLFPETPLVRLLAYSASLIIGLSMLAVLPGTRSMLTSAGRHSYEIYLVQTVIMYPLTMVFK